MADAIPVLVRAQAELARAASADGLAVAALDGTETSTCEVTMARQGVRLQAPVLAFVPAGTEEALLRRVADRLPESYGASVRTGSLPRLSADAGTWVAISGTVIAPGQVRLLADTGDCRPAGDAELAHPLRVGDQSAVRAALDRLGVAAQTWSTHVVGCDSGGSVETVEAVTGEGVDTGPLDVRLRGLAGTGSVVSTPDLVAYRAADAGVALRVAGGRIVATATTIGCAQ